KSHRFGIGKFYALEPSTAQKLQNSTRGSVPPLGNCGISRAGVVHRSEIAESHALERSTARELRNRLRGEGSPLGNGVSARADQYNLSEMSHYISRNYALIG